jgi:methylenetetrahydrofolate reductase (NADPH)
VKLIRKEYGNHFGIAVAGFPEGHPNGEGDIRTDIAHLKEKVDAGADFILTNFFYDTNVFIDYVTRCREAGITCPIIPGQLSFLRRLTALVTFLYEQI